MNMFLVIKSAFTVLQKGQELKNVEAWKDRQVLFNLLFAALVIGSQFVPESYGINNEMVSSVADGIAVAVASLANAYFTIATTKKIGLSGKETEENELSESEPELESTDVAEISTDFSKDPVPKSDDRVVSKSAVKSKQLQRSPKKTNRNEVQTSCKIDPHTDQRFPDGFGDK